MASGFCGLFPALTGGARATRAVGLLSVAAVVVMATAAVNPTTAPLAVAPTTASLSVAIPAGPPGPPLHWGTLGMGMLGGLALFLYGLELMGGALKGIAGSRLKVILGRLTRNRLSAFLTGAFFTSVIQSSSVTTVLVVGFVTVGLLPLTAAIGVILGADVGTTITSQILAFKVTKYALLLIAAGFLLSLLRRPEAVRQWGVASFGLGLIFYGMGLMSDAMSPLRESETFVTLMTRLTPLGGVIIATIFTGVIQASAATMGVILVLASQGLISLESGIALAFGANIGTCATAGLAALGKPRPAVRAALAHVMFKILGVVIFFPFIPQIAQFIRFISPSAPEGMAAMEALARVAPRQIANAHTFFNVGIGLIFLPFTGVFAWLLEKIVPDRAAPAEAAEGPERFYLDRSLLGTPVLALGMARLQLNTMAEIVRAMLTQSADVVFRGDREKADRLRAMDERVDRQHELITDYLSRIGEMNLSSSATDETLDAATISAELEAIGDIIETNLTHLAVERLEDQVALAPESIAACEAYHHETLKAFGAAALAYVTDNREAAGLVIKMKERMQRAEADVEAQGFRALRRASGKAEMNAFIWQRDIIGNLHRIYYHTKRIAKIAAHDQGVAAGDDEILAPLRPPAGAPPPASPAEGDSDVS